MSDDQYDDNTPDEELPPAVRAQREHIRNLEAQLREKNDLERKVAFLEAGVNLESKAGQLLFKAYDGELTAEAITAEAAELGAIKAATPPAEQPSRVPGEERSTDLRRDIANGGVVDEARGEDPRTLANNHALEMMKGGSSTEVAIGEAFGMLAEAGYKGGDQRVIYRPDNV